MTEQQALSSDDLSDYAADAAKPTPDALRQLTNLAERAKEAIRERDRIAAELKRADEMVDLLTEKEIPALMDSINLKRFSLSDGTGIEVKETLRVSLSKANNERGVEFFDGCGRSGIVKREVAIRFNRDETALVNKFMADLRKRKTQLRVNVSSWIEPATLKKEITEMLEAGEDVPLDIFSVFPQRVAKISAP